MAHRISHGTDRLIERDGGYDLVCREDKGWVGRRERGALQRPFPGSCVNWDEELFEVVSVERTAKEIRYALVPWDESNTIRVMEHYSDDAETFRAEDRRDVGSRESHRKLAILFSLVIGHLPREVQERMEREWGVAATLMTLMSVVPMLFLGGGGLVLLMAESFGAAFGAGPIFSIPKWVLFLGPVIFVESLFRLAIVLGQSRAIGSMVGTRVYLVWRAMTNRGSVRTQPGRAATVDRSIVIQDRYDLMEPCLALLDPAEQRLLEHRFGFAPVHWGKRTAWVLMIAMLPLLIPSVTKIVSGTASILDFLVFVFSATIVIEQIMRLFRLTSGKPAGSLLGRVVRPFVRMVLREG